MFARVDYFEELVFTFFLDICLAHLLCWWDDVEEINQDCLELVIQVFNPIVVGIN